MPARSPGARCLRTWPKPPCPSGSQYCEWKEAAWWQVPWPLLWDAAALLDRCRAGQRDPYNAWCSADPDWQALGCLQLGQLKSPIAAALCRACDQLLTTSSSPGTRRGTTIDVNAMSCSAWVLRRMHG